MKARIKKTGEIVNIAEYAKIALDKCDSYGNPIEVKPEDIELIEDITEEDEHWQDVRERAVIAALNGLLSRPNSKGTFASYAKDAINCANALIEELKKRCLEYKDGDIVEIGQKKELVTEFECGYKQAIEDTCVFLHLEPVSFIDDYRKTMEQNLKRNNYGNN